MQKNAFIALSAISGLLLLTADTMSHAADTKEKKSTEPQTLFKSKPGTKMEGMVTPDVKTSLAPHSVMIQTSLQTAMNQIQGIRNQLDIQVTPTPELIDHMKMHSREINNDLKTAMNHEVLLQSQAKKFPEVSGKDDLRAMSKALDEVSSFNQGWQSRTNRSDYWRNKEQVRADLDRFERNISAALDKTKNFSVSTLDITPTFG